LFIFIYLFFLFPFIFCFVFFSRTHQEWGVGWESPLQVCCSTLCPVIAPSCNKLLADVIQERASWWKWARLIQCLCCKTTRWSRVPCALTQTQSLTAGCPQRPLRSDDFGTPRPLWVCFCFLVPSFPLYCFILQTLWFLCVRWERASERAHTRIVHRE